MRIDSDGKVGIGTATPETILEISTGSTDVDLDVALSTYSDTAGTYSTLILRKADGTEADPDLVTDNDILGEVRFDAWDKDTGGNFLPGAYIRAVVNGTPGENDMPTELIFATTADSGSAPTERMWINQAGNVGIGTASPTAQLDINSDANQKGLYIDAEGTTYTALDVRADAVTTSGIAYFYSNSDSASTRNLVSMLIIVYMEMGGI
jgi:hypothetical protein